MENIDIQVLRACAQWIEQNQKCELVTVVKTWGSSPRPAGSMLAINESGAVVGSVSGGCIEDDLISNAQRNGLSSERPGFKKYGLTADEAHRFGLPCGGTIELLIEPLSRNSQIAQVLEMLQSRQQLVARKVELSSGLVSLSTASSGMTLSLDDDSVTTIFGPRWRLLIIGAGQLSQIVAQFAIVMGYNVTVCDPRDEYGSLQSISGVTLTKEMPDDVVSAMRPDARTAVMALTHDPKLDDLALMEALKSDAFYVGAIGSEKNNAKRRERLALFDLNPDQLSRLRGPIGLPIGSKTPPEIAISSLAEMTAVRNGADSFEPRRRCSTAHVLQDTGVAWPNLHIP